MWQFFRDYVRMRDDDVPCCEAEFWVFLVMSVGLVAFAGVTSGLALGLLSFSQVDLEVLIRAGLPKDQKNAAKILPLVKNEHLLLCTLLICKSLAMEALPIFLDSILPSWAAILVSVTLVMAFAEIIPQAVFARYGLSLSAKMAALVRLLLCVFYFISYPASKLLDCLLGEAHTALLRRAELKTLVGLHSNEAGKGGDLSHHETSIINGALDLTQKTAKDAMTAISETFSLDINSKLDMHTMAVIMSKGHSRIPIYAGNKTNIIGLILVKNLIFCRPEDETPVKLITMRSIARVYEDWPLYDVMSQFLKGHSHMAVVLKAKRDVKHTVDNAEGKPIVTGINGSLGPNPKLTDRKEYSSSLDGSPLHSSEIVDQSTTMRNFMEGTNPQFPKTNQRDQNMRCENSQSIPSNSQEEVVGIITLEDVMEELLQEDILDETDEYVDVHNKIKVNLLHSKASPSKSPRRSPSPYRLWRSPQPSPLSPYTHHILRSPFSPYVQSPLIAPSLAASPGNAISNSSAVSLGPSCGSSTSHWAPRKAYKKLQQTSHT